ncbi:CRISPR-associated ring nuclease Csm6 [methanotrophic endosymbiont of Bathymodiolus puteoserpentis (Logatchev)]|jgi:CRISPR-associated protein (TIGR02584 family)|uniref:CRISPR-associated ring nuclease Csm6 n=1 Tax=methanotrophic endosymbiont of Bathymodiolus puteoserpentis (Logatchev) TaxID=343235 RepID=UPI0013C5537F|nr:CRISPR-associated ring nuclease Csm6 [methanotrophic endosymbiont of Bathymodiolus puteoserpentis (Logatchev)]SHE19622.1 CRISPR-associated protein, Csx3 family [methanotrophic endosymbiont of Bathymodiolus puteoserpentis (Logatchev)]
MHPYEYKKRILIAVSGLSPQILTETLYGLAIKQKFIPTEIHLITTIEGAHRANLSLLHPEKGHFHALCREYQLPAIRFDAEQIHIIADAKNNQLDDIRTPAQNSAAADYITRIIKELTHDADSAVHVSIAGGRKTMGYYLGYALSLFGRSQDRLSHVLVEEGYEGLPRFYYPTLQSNLIETRDNRPLDTSKAEVTLAEIPFIRMRQDIPEKLLQGKAGFLETITLARKAELTPELIIDLVNKKISANGEVFTMPDIQLAFYCWLLKQTVVEQTRLEKPRPQKPREDYVTAFMAVYKKIAGEAKDTDKTEASLIGGMKSSFFSDKTNSINAALISNLGSRLAKPYCINKIKTRLTGEYFTDLLPEQIQFSIIE